MTTVHVVAGWGLRLWPDRAILRTKKRALYFVAPLLFLAACGPAEDADCTSADTRCDGLVAVTCELILCTVGPCPTVLDTKTCESGCVLVEDSAVGVDGRGAVCE